MYSLLFRLAALLTMGIACAASPAIAQQYPNRPVHIVVGYAPGGSTDTGARMIGQKLQEALGQPFIVENRPGANAIVAHQLVSKAAPDGYTLIFSSSADTVNVSLNPNTTYNYLTDFAPIARLTQSSFLVVVPPQTPIKSLAELYEFGRNGKINFGSSGVGTPSHLGAELMFLTKNIKATHAPYDGAGPLSAAIMGGEIQLAFINMSSSINLAKAGKLRAIGVSTAERSSLIPEVPTVAESGLPGFNVVSWGGLDAPAGTPANIIKLLADTSLAALATPDFKEALAKVGNEPFPADSKEYAAFLKNEVDIWAKVVKSAGIKAQ